MVQRTDSSVDAEADDRDGWSRRTLLRVSGAGVGLATALGITAAAGQEGDGEGGDEGNQTNGNETGNQTDAGDSSVVFDDLTDPTWGYPLAADESAAVTVEPVVDMHTEEGEGAHSGFPMDPETGEELPVEFLFDPVGLHVQPGELVKFTTSAGEHTATAFHEKFGGFGVEVTNRVPEGVPGFSSPPIVEGESWLYEFESKGVYDVLCLPHMFAGMVMRIVVYDPEEDDIESDTFAAQPTDNLPPSVTAVLDAEELTPANIVDAGSVAWADLTLEMEEGTPTDGEGTSTPTDDDGTSTPTDDGETPTPTDDDGTSTPTDDGTVTPTDDSGGNSS